MITQGFELLEKSMGVWHDVVLELEQPSFSPFAKGRTFVGCQSHQGTRMAAIKTCKMNLRTATALEHMGRIQRHDAREQHQAEVQRYNERRGGDRVVAIEAHIKTSDDRYEMLYEAAVAQNAEAEDRRGDLAHTMGLNSIGFAAVHLPSANGDNTVYDSVKPGLKEASLILLDLRDVHDPANYMRYNLPLLL